MKAFVVDASVAAKWFVEEEYSPTALSILGGAAQLHAPDFMLLEMDSIITKWTRRGAIGLDEGSDIRNALRQYPIQFHSFPSFLDSAFAIASQTGQSVYDSLYVALAALLKRKLATADRRLYDGLKNSPFQKSVVWIGDIV
ncbi:MAG: type II toxin-antitoxin system VapC family toxin [Nitrospinae bacterium]|nr:type II toxin-antitoxin system VapC family toxin [Nitrospinota bacterium]